MMNKLIENIVHEEIEKLLNENLSENLYHFTSLQRLEQIIKTNSFCLSSIYNSGDDSEFFSKKLFYMCFSREKSCVSGFAQNTGKKVRIEIDGNKLRHNFSGKPINYYHKDGGIRYYMSLKSKIPYIQPEVENEDRLFSNKGIIKNAISYIKRIDIYYDPKDLINKNDIKKIINLMNTKFGDKIYVYFKYKDFTLQTKNVLTDEEIENIKKSNDINQKEFVINKERYLMTIKMLIADLFGNFFNYGYYYLNKKNIDFNSLFVKILEKYHIDDFVEYIQNFDFKNYRVYSNINSVLIELQNITIDKELYVKFCRVVKTLFNYFDIYDSEKIRDLGFDSKANEEQH